MPSAVLTRVFLVAIFFVFFNVPSHFSESHPDASSNYSPGGTVQGHIEIKTTFTGMPKGRGGRYRQREYGSSEHEIKLPVEPEVTNVVIYLEEVDKKSHFSPASVRPVLDQRNTTFIPHILPILKGSEVDFVNLDNIYHNVFSLSSAKRFDIGRRPTGEKVTVKFDQSGVVPVYCDIHSNMSAYILVLDNPYFTKPDANGNFRLASILPGRYRIIAWHERLIAQPKEITVPASGVVTVDFTL